MTAWTRSKGLLGRSGLDPDEGLWIQPTGSIHMWFMRFAIDVVYADKRGARSEARPRHPSVAHVGVPWREGRARAPGRRDRPGRRRGRRPSGHRAHVIELELTPPRPYRPRRRGRRPRPDAPLRRRRARAGAAHRGRPRPGAGLAAPRRDARRPAHAPTTPSAALDRLRFVLSADVDHTPFLAMAQRRPAAGAARPPPSRPAALPLRDLRPGARPRAGRAAHSGRRGRPDRAPGARRDLGAA